MSRYADAGIPHYWLVETDPDEEVIAFELVEGAYRGSGRLGELARHPPGPMRLHVDVGALGP
jgi:hypothetical protein